MSELWIYVLLFLIVVNFVISCTNVGHYATQKTSYSGCVFCKALEAM